MYKNAIPHKGYRGLLELCQSKEDYFVVTTHVDGLFIKAGFPTEKVHEVHGTIHRLQCSMPCSRNVWYTEGLDVDVDYSTMRALDTLPLCPECGCVSRPNICIYGDTDESYIWEEAQKNANRLKAWREKNLHKKVVMLEIGVGAEGLKRHMEQYCEEFSDVTLIRINPELDDLYGDSVLHISSTCKKFFSSLTHKSKPM